MKPLTALLIGIILGGLGAVAYMRPEYLVPAMSLVVGIANLFLPSLYVPHRTAPTVF